MQQRDNTAHFILTGAVVFGLTLLVAVVDAQAQIVFSSDRDGNFEIYVMDADGGNQQRLTRNQHSDVNPALFGPAFAVAPAGRNSRFGDGSNRAFDNCHYWRTGVC